MMQEQAALESGRDYAVAASRDWLYAGALATGAIVWLLAWYWPTAWSIVSIWMRSETFAHGFLIFPVSAYLVWSRRRELAALTPQPDYRVLPLLAAFGFSWMLASLAGVLIVQHYSLVIMIPLLVWLVLGSAVARALAFPLLFLLFAVPVGEFLLPPLMAYTADFTVFALQLTGIPVYRDGLFFAIPSGQWSVIEACSGLRYLISSVTLGWLYAYLTYRSTWRRAVFIALSMVVPIVANGLRAYMIVMIGHLSGMKLATGVDHVIYGWVFFSLVTLLLFWFGSFWREQAAEPGRNEPGPASAARSAAPERIALAALAAGALVTVWPLYASRLENAGPARPPVLEAPAGSGGWQAVSAKMTDWTPHFANPRAEINQVYIKDGRRVGLYIGYYNYQHQGAELISSENMLVSSGNKLWAKSGESARDLRAGGQRMAAVQTRLRGTHANLLAWNWYWVEGRRTVNPYFGKLLEAVAKLFATGDDAAVVILYAPYEDRPADAEAPLRDFLEQMLPAAERSLDAANRG
ncbi:MAG: exosortase A [Sulfuricella sp.]|nr:exosortase A [Sulfuricella sp.]